MSLECLLLIDVIGLAPENSRWMFSEGSTNLPQALIQFTERKHDNYYSILLTSWNKTAIKELIARDHLVDKIVHQFIEGPQSSVLFEGYDHLTGCFIDMDFPRADYLLEKYQEVLEEMS